MQRRSDVYRLPVFNEKAGRSQQHGSGGVGEQGPADNFAAIPVAGNDPEAIEMGLLRNLRRMLACHGRVELVGTALKRQITTDSAKESNQARREYQATASARQRKLVAAWNVHMASAEAHVARLAPKTASLPWHDPCWKDVPTKLEEIPQHLRLGMLALSNVVAPLVDVPPILVAPFLGSTGIAMHVDAESLSAADAMLQSLLLRTMASVPAGHLEISVFDPRLRGPVGVFSSVRHEAPGLLRETMTKTSNLASALDEAATSVRHVADLLKQNDQPNLGRLEAALGQFVEPHRVIVVLDYPMAIDAHVHRLLVTLAESGPARGVVIIVQMDGSSSPAHGVEPAELTAHLLSLKPVLQPRWEARSITSMPFVPDEPPEHAQMEALCRRIAHATCSAAVPTLEFEELLPLTNPTWTESDVDGLVAVIGKAGSRQVSISLRSENPPLPNLLLGGAVGQGKSNLLLVLLHAWAARYSPDHLEFYLLDYKEGVEFARLGPSAGYDHWLPHLRVLGLESDREFGLAVLRHLEREREDRASRFIAARVSAIDAYRHAHPETRMPRIVLVIDEFQVLLEGGGAEAENAVELLEQLARTGRGFGIHLVLSSQTLSGIQSLRIKEDAIFGQFPWRVALKTTANDSQAILGMGNQAAATLRFRGEAIVNSAFGEVVDNQRVLVARSDERHLSELRRALWQKAGAAPRPRIFRGSRPARYDEMSELRALRAKEWRAESAPCAWVGVPVAVEHAPATFCFSSDRGRTLAVIGEGRDEALGVVSSTIISLAAQHPAAEAEFMLVDLVAMNGVETLCDVVDSYGHAIRTLGREDAGEAVFRLKDSVDRRFDKAQSTQTTLYLVLIGAHRAVRFNRDDPERMQSPLDALRYVIEEGPMAQVFVVGWWGSYRAFSNDMGFQLKDAVQGMAFFKVPQSDIQAELGPYTTWRPRSNRGLFWDRGHAHQPTTIVPFEPVREQHASGLRAIGRKP